VLLRSKTIERLGKGGVALGIMPEATFDEQRLELQNGDQLLVYSDGLTEAQNPTGEFFGEQRLLDLLPELSGFTSEQLGERLVSEVDWFVGDGRATDDLSIVVLRKA
jgi:sigma-B regulation protein RsbU (phosphoserine phosphatase)